MFLSSLTTTKILGSGCVLVYPLLFLGVPIDVCNDNKENVYAKINSDNVTLQEQVNV